MATVYLNMRVAYEVQDAKPDWDKLAVNDLFEVVGALIEKAQEDAEVKQATIEGLPTVIKLV